MENFIDLMSNTTFTDVQIGKRLNSIERSRYSLQEEGILNRIVSGISLGIYAPTSEDMQQIGAFNEFMGEMVLLGASVRTDNQLLIDTIKHEKAAARLAQYILLEGVPEVPMVPATYETIVDEIDGVETIIELTPEIPGIPAVEPLQEFIEVQIYDELTESYSTSSIRNPMVVKDEEERTIAQGIIDMASDDVIGLFEKRKPS